MYVLRLCAYCVCVCILCVCMLCMCVYMHTCMCIHYREKLENVHTGLFEKKQKPRVVVNKKVAG